MAKKRIGILSGSFDPVRLSDIRTALFVLDSSYADSVLFLPFLPGSAPAGDRWKMLVSACATDSRLVPSGMALDLGLDDWNVNLLRSLRKTYGNADLIRILRPDDLMSLSAASDLAGLFRHCSFLVLLPEDQPDSSVFYKEAGRLTAMGGRFRVVPSAPVPDYSCFTSDELDVSVLEYCRCKGLYGLDGRLEHIDAWMDQLFAALKPRRFAHSLSVACTSRQLAVLHGSDPLKAEQAGLLHDCAKCLPMKEMRRIAENNALTDDENVLSSDALLHSIVGASVAETDYGMTDPEVLDAIRFHNTGYPGMSRLSMCVCLADFMEPLRQSFPLLEAVRFLSRTSLEKALLLSLEGTVRYVLARGWYLYPRTGDTIRWLQSLPGVRDDPKADRFSGPVNS